jgi:glycerol-3-phosphate dehydrogenase
MTAELQNNYRLDFNAARHLVHRYGRRSVDVAAYLVHSPQLARRVLAEEPDLQVEFLYQREHEMAKSDADCLLRRTRLGLFHPQLVAASKPALRLRGA